MTKRAVHPASVLLAAISLIAAIALSPGWVFGKYPNLATAMDRGDVTAAQVGDASPAYLLLHAVASPQVVRWLQAIAAAMTVGLLFELLRRRADVLAAGIAAGVLALAQQWLIYSAVMEPDLLIGAAIVLTIALLDASVMRLAFAGLAMGAAVSLRPTALLFGVLTLGWLIKRKTSRRGLVAFVLTAAIASVLPSTILKLKSGNELRGTMSVGQVFHQSHRPESVGFGATFPALLKVVEAQAVSEGPHPPDFAHELYRELARASDTSRTSAFDAEVFWFARSVAFFQNEPVAALGQLVDKFIFFVAPPTGEYDIPAVQPLLQRGWGLRLRWLTLLAFGCLLVLIATRSEEAVPWALSWLAALGVALLFYFHGRYAVGVVPALAALIGLGLAKAWRERRRRWVFPLLLAPLLILASAPVRWGDRMVERLNLINATAPPSRDAYLDEQAAVPDAFWPTSPHGVGVGAGDLETAQLAAVRAEERFGTSSPVDATPAAALWASAGRCDKALELADRAAASGFVWAMSDRSIDPSLVASDCLVRLGRPREALDRLEATNHAHPGRLDTLVRLVAAADVGNQTDVVRWERELEELHDSASVHFALANARRQWGDPQGAISDADWLIAHWPRAAPFAEHERSLAFVELRQPENALTAWARALVINAGLHDQNLLDPFVTALTTSAPNDSRVAELAGRHWRKRGVPAPQP